MVGTNNSKYHGACHCRSVTFEVKLTDGLRTARRCNCSFCTMRGAVAVSALLDDLKITAGETFLTLYEFGTRSAKHYFCSRCGIYTHHQRRSNPNQYGINVACLHGISPFDFEQIPVLNGHQHPTDHPDKPLDAVVGILRFESSELKVSKS